MRLIDADALKDMMLQAYNDALPEFDMPWKKKMAHSVTLSFMADIDEAPTVDAVPVVHGKWIPFEEETGVEAFGYKEYTTLGFRCSVCHADIDVSEQYFRYCPMCGAKMSNGDRKGGDE